MRRGTIAGPVLAVGAALSLGAPAACDAGHAAMGSGLSSTSAPATARAPGAVGPPPLSPAAAVGKRLFFDQSLSASGEMSCATCHDPAHAYGPPNGLAVQLGGPERTAAGFRAVPSLRYTEYTPAYADLLDNPDGVSVPGPGGGFAWDGRANTLAEQAKLPLLSPVEMANASPADAVAKVRASATAAQFEAAFGAAVWRDTDKAFNDLVAALQAFQIEDPSFHPYTSKFDLHAGNKIGGTFTAAEARGQRVFVDPKTGNCASCHWPGAGLNGSSGLFTDFSYEAIGVPRNPAIPANADAGYVDLGLCGPLRTDHAQTGGARNRFCGMFKTPSLRNAATRSVFFHNGAMHSLEQAVRFYNTRDSRPELWYPTVDGKRKPNAERGLPAYGLVTAAYVGGAVQKFDDLPRASFANIDPQMPLDGRRAGTKSPMTEHEVADLLCFLRTLTDDYRPPSSPPTSGPCVE